MSDKAGNIIRERIVERCTDIFLNRGFAKISMDEIAGAMGMSKKTIYKYFSNKEELVKSVMLNFRDSTLERIEAVNNEEVLDFYLRFIKLLEVIGKQLSQIKKPIIEDIKKYMPELWREIEVKRTIVLSKVFEKVITEGKNGGIIRKDTDVDFFLLIYMSLISSILTPDVLSNIPFNPSQAFHNIVKTLFSGILTDEARSKYQNEYQS